MFYVVRVNLFKLAATLLIDETGSFQSACYAPLSCNQLHRNFAGHLKTLALPSASFHQCPFVPHEKEAGPWAFFVEVDWALSCFRIG